MNAEISELTVNFEEDGIVLVKEIDKVILSKGAWTTIIFRYQQWDKKTSQFSPDRFTIRRYKKIKNAYSQQSKFNISSREQAEKIVQALQLWLKD
ncbi:MAG: hypothetical protein A2511_14130 [Deltaproteobacteria bacterium RIFOXYD12_FULL_50_9]|nr:MAG: hypothetical protein A2511_14130 [Deltaproteobacteria bacterium RIFOXYD12_FULL_50_9]